MAGRGERCFILHGSLRRRERGKRCDLSLLFCSLWVGSVRLTINAGEQSFRRIRDEVKVAACQVTLGQSFKQRTIVSIHLLETPSQNPNFNPDEIITPNKINSKASSIKKWFDLQSPDLNPIQSLG